MHLLFPLLDGGGLKFVSFSVVVFQLLFCTRTVVSSAHTRIVRMRAALLPDLRFAEGSR